MEPTEPLNVLIHTDKRDRNGNTIYELNEQALGKMLLSHEIKDKKVWKVLFHYVKSYQVGLTEKRSQWREWKNLGVKSD